MKILDEKVCLTCDRPFTWRKKWEKNWKEVKYCSKRCRSSRKNGNENIKINSG
ncbi:MAG: DUF2256 domain-containing protein [Cytophagales bacterium]|nr:DUF2256 domain-containing protein [Cytophagales bacterium]